ncbi:MAG: PAS domain-containing protein [Pseudomonadota bacterium]
MATISETLSRFVRESPIALTLASPGFDDCPLVLVNDAFARLTGYPPEYALGRNCRFLQGEETETDAKAKLRSAITTRSEAIVPITNYRRDGSKFRNLVFVFPVFSANGDMLFMMGSQYDVTAPSRAVSPREFGHILDEHIALHSPLLAEKDAIRIDATGFDFDRIADLVEE